MIESIQPHRSPRRLQALREAIRQTLAYAAVFEYPLTAAELHRYLHGVPVSRAELLAVLEDGVPGVHQHCGLYMPAGRLWTVAERRRRQVYSEPLLRRALRYARVISYLPFVRMIGLTGSLAMRNVSGHGDIDLMIVTAPGRVWLCRAGVIAVVHLARLIGDPLCPNYVVAENALVLDESTVYDAHELAQLLPLYGGTVYQRLWECNGQVTAQLPNAQPWACGDSQDRPVAPLVKRLAERLLGGALGDALEGWERRRKTDRFGRHQAASSPEIVFSPDQCKGHFEGHRTRVLEAFEQRLASMVESAFPAFQPEAPARREATGR